MATLRSQARYKLATLLAGEFTSRFDKAACSPHHDTLVGSLDLPALCRCSATVLKDGREGKYEKEGYGQRLYTNWEKIMFDCEGEVREAMAT